MTGNRFLIHLPHIAITLLIVLFACGCDKYDIGEEYILRKYVASFNSETKTSLGSGNQVSWSEGDWIWYYSKDAGLLRMYTVEEDGESAELQLNVAASASYLVAVHGASSISNYSGSSLTIQNVINPVQNGSFSDGHVAIARLDDVTAESIQFHNLTSFIAFSTAQENIDHIIFTAKDGTALHGNGSVRVSFEGDLPSGTLSGGDSSIKVMLSGAGTYYIAMLPTVLSSGFTIECYDSDGTKIASASGKKGLEVKRSSIFRIGNIDSHLLDERGIRLFKYDEDTNWDSDIDANGNIGNNGYGNDANWDSGSGSDGGINNGNYGSDYDWDDGVGTGGTIDRNGYGDDSDWDNDSNSGSDINKGGYGDDSNWDTGSGSNGGIGSGGYGDDSNWDSSNGSSGDIEKGGYGDDSNWDRSQQTSNRAFSLKRFFKNNKQIKI